MSHNPTEAARTEITPLWTDARIREAFIDDGGQADYHDPINGAREQRRIAGEIFDRWLAARDAQPTELQTGSKFDAQPTPTDDEREALARLDYGARNEDVPHGQAVGATIMGDVAVALRLARRHPSPPTQAPTREALRDDIADEISGISVGSGYYSTTIGIDAAREAADAVIRLLASPAGQAPNRKLDPVTLRWAANRIMPTNPRNDWTSYAEGLAAAAGILVAEADRIEADQ